MLDKQCVIMIAYVMVWDFNRLRNKFFWLIPLFVVFMANCQNSNTQEKPENKQTIQDSVKVVVNVDFESTGVFSLNSLKDQRNYSIVLHSNQQGSRKTATLDFDKPTVLLTFGVGQGKSIVHRYFVFGKRDTLSFKFTSNGSIYTGQEKINILNDFIKKDDAIFLLSPNVKDPFLYLKDINDQYSSNLKAITAKKGLFTAKEFQALLDYLALYRYQQLFNIDFAELKNANQIETWNSLYNDINQHLELLNKLNTTLSKTIVYNLIRYQGFKNKNQHLLENVPSLDKGLLKNKAFMGFIQDYAESGKKLTTKEKEIIKAYVPKEAIAQPDLEASSLLTEKVLESKVETPDYHWETLQNVLDTKGKELTLVDLWATWCVPCLHEIPYWEKAEKKYDGKIKFVKISIDQDEKKWRQFLIKHQDKDLNYLIKDAHHPFIQTFQINAIPRYILLNDKGKILSDDFPRPSDADFNSKLEIYLK